MMIITCYDNLYNNIPAIVRILIKIIHCSVMDVYKIENDNYSPIMTFLVFNFIISPKLQEIFKISNYDTLILDLNRILRVIYSLIKEYRLQSGVST